MVRESLYEKHLENFMSRKEIPIRDPIIVFKNLKSYNLEKVIVIVTK